MFGGKRMTTTTKQVFKVGLDLGTNTTVFQVSKNGEKVDYEQDILSSIVGYPKPGILPGIIPNDPDKVFANEAVNYRIHLDLKWPLKDGHIDDPSVSRDFMQHIKDCVNLGDEGEIWAVIGVPAHATAENVKKIRFCVSDVFQKIVVVPEPFLAAMGLRDESKVADSSYVDPTRHSMIVDIGAGTTDICLVRGYYPTKEDQVSYPVAGDAIDNKLSELIRRKWPDLNLTRVTVTRLKEKYSFVEAQREEANVKLYADGKPRMLDIADLVCESCEILVPVITKGIKELLKQCDSDSVQYILQNVILCGGGSAILGLSDMVQKQLRSEGYDDAVCRKPSDYQRLVAIGALKVAEGVKDNQWQIPI